jgi:hypothetical protein
MTPETRALLVECREVLEQALRCKDACGDPDKECPMQDAEKPYAYPQLIARLRAAADAGEGETANERFDRHADAFTKATGYTALGRSHPMAFGGFDEEKRNELWHAFQAGLKTAYAYRERTP